MSTEKDIITEEGSISLEKGKELLLRYEERFSYLSTLFPRKLTMHEEKCLDSKQKKLAEEQAIELKRLLERNGRSGIKLGDPWSDSDFQPPLSNSEQTDTKSSKRSRSTFSSRC